jgi:hypothetical protein
MRAIFLREKKSLHTFAFQKEKSPDFQTGIADWSSPHRIRNPHGVVNG